MARRKQHKPVRSRTPARSEEPTDPIPTPEQESDALFKAQMAVANFVLGQWKAILGVIGVGLLITLFAGLYRNYLRDVQQDIHAQIAAVDNKMPEPSELARLGLGPIDDLSEPGRKAQLEAGAVRYESVAEDASGTGQVIAWLRAAQTWERAQNIEAANKAYEQAVQVDAQGIVGEAATFGLAAIRAETGDVDGAATLLRGLADIAEGFAAEQALYQLGMLYEDAGRKDESATVYEEFTERYPSSSLAPTVAEAMLRVWRKG